MLHKSRIWCVHSVTDAEDLARKLTESTWTLCTAFELNFYLFANDSTGPDGAQEYAVFNARHHTNEWKYRQIESITFSWCTFEKARELIQRILQREFDQQALDVASLERFQSPQQHGTCCHCA